MAVNGTYGFESKKNIHRQNQIKPCGSWWYIEVLRHETISLCKKLNSIYIIFYLWSTTLSKCPELFTQQPARDVSTCSGSDIKYDINTVQFLAQTDCFMSSSRVLVSSRAAGFNLVLSVYVCFFLLSKTWVPLTAIIWLTDATVWVKNLCLCSTEETKSPTSWMPLG